MRKTGLIRTLLFAAWLSAVGWLVRYEAYPERFTGVLDGYADLLSDQVLGMDAWTRVLFNGTPIGYGHTTVTTDETDPAAYCEIGNQLHLSLKIMGEQQRIRVDTHAWLDALMRLQRFEFSLHARGYRMQLKGMRGEGSNFEVAVRTDHSTRRLQVTIPDDVVLNSPLIDATLRDMRPGQTLTLKTFDPTTLTIVPIGLKAVRRESMTVAGEAVDALIVDADYQGMTARSWIDAQGKVLRQETAFGWTLEACSMEAAFDALDKAAAADDILVGTAVPCSGIIEDPRGSERLILRLEGVPFTEAELTTPRQRVIAASDAGVTVELLSGDRVHDGQAALDPARRRALLAASGAIQSDHPDLRDAARRIVGDARTADERVDRIADWVYRHIDKRGTLSLPSALDVLHTRQGDCNEHTYLFVALARAAGVPSAVMVGVAYNNGVFNYHAWPAVYTDRWRELDPTWGQLAVDATHIALAQGELADQLRLLKVMGKLEIVVPEETRLHDTD